MNQLTKVIGKMTPSIGFISLSISAAIVLGANAASGATISINIDDLTDRLTVTSSNPMDYIIQGVVTEIDPTPSVEKKERLTFALKLDSSLPPLRFNGKGIDVKNEKVVFTSPFDPNDMAGGGSVSDVLTIEIVNNSLVRFVFESADGGFINGIRIDPRFPDRTLEEDGSYQKTATITRDFGPSSDIIEVNVRSVSSCASQESLPRSSFIASIGSTIKSFFITSAYAQTIPADVCRVPEPSSNLGILVIGSFGLLGAASTLKRKLNPSKSSEKETTKVS